MKHALIYLYYNNYNNSILIIFLFLLFILILYIFYLKERKNIFKKEKLNFEFNKQNFNKFCKESPYLNGFSLTLTLDNLEQINNNYSYHIVDKIITQFLIYSTKILGVNNCIFRVSETKFNILRHMNIDISLDDFSTGFSSVHLLANLPLKKIKFDKLLLDNCKSPKGQQIYIKLIELIKSFEIEIVAEGVETNFQLDFLKKYNIDYIQGYFIGKPDTIDKFIPL